MLTSILVLEATRPGTTKRDYFHDPVVVAILGEVELLVVARAILILDHADTGRVTLVKGDPRSPRREPETVSCEPGFSTHLPPLGVWAGGRVYNERIQLRLFL